jgi:DNA topoisomerase-3
MLCPFCKNSVKKHGLDYVCTAHNGGCNFRVRAEIGGKKITQSQILMLLNSGRTAIIKGFIGKNGQVFDAALKINFAKSKVEFDFPKY